MWLAGVRKEVFWRPWTLELALVAKAAALAPHVPQAGGIHGGEDPGWPSGGSSLWQPLCSASASPNQHCPMSLPTPPPCLFGMQIIYSEAF